ncbi:L37A2 protein, partial [Nothocercus nigrocapillus]|nr:L37A2 protein [Nothocercus nigrocapillus]
NQHYPGAMEQAKNPHEMEDVADGKEAPPPSHSYVWTYKRKGQQESPCQRSDQLFYRPDHEENPEEEPTPTPSKPEQGLNSAGQFFYNLLVTSSRPVAMSALENKPKDTTSSPGEHSLGTQPTDETLWKHPKEGGSHFPSKPSSSGSPAAAPAREDLFETKLKHHLRLLVPDKAVRAFVAHAAHALRSDCGLPAAQPACAKMVSKLGLLMKVLGEKQGGRGASALAGRCFLEGDIPNGTTQPKAAGRKLMGKKWEFAGDNGLLIAVSVSLAIILFLMVICLIEVCSQKSAAASQPQGTSKSRLRRAGRCPSPRAQLLRVRNAPTPGALQGSPGSDPGGNKPPWLRDMYEPLDSQRKRSLAQQLYDEESSDEEEIFSKAELR